MQQHAGSTAHSSAITKVDISPFTSTSQHTYTKDNTSSPSASKTDCTPREFLQAMSVVGRLAQEQRCSPTQTSTSSRIVAYTEKSHSVRSQQVESSTSQPKQRSSPLADKKPYVIGMHIWNFADFKTGQAVLRMGGLNHKGVFTRDRQPKMAAHMLRKRWHRSNH